MNITGFEFNPSSISSDVKCDKINNYYIKVAMLLDRKYDRFERWKKLFENCLPRISKEQVLKLRFAKTPPKDVAALEAALTKASLTKKQIARIKNIYTLMSKKREVSHLIDKFISNYEELSKTNDEGSKYLIKQKIIKITDNIPSNFIKDLMELTTAAESNNYGWIKKTMERIARIRPHEIIFSVQPVYFTSAKQVEKVSNIITQEASKISSKAKDSLQYKIMVNRLNKWIQNNESKKIVQESDATWSLATIRKELTFGRMNSKFLNFWIQELEDRTADQERNILLKKILTPKYIANMDTSDLWLLHYYYPAATAPRVLLSEHIIKAYNSKNPYLKYLVISLLDNEVIKKELMAKNNEFKKALFQIKRNFYRQTLNTGEAVYFSLYNLIRLGDKSHDNLWWLVF